VATRRLRSRRPMRLHALIVSVSLVALSLMTGCQAMGPVATPMMPSVPVATPWRETPSPPPILMTYRGLTDYADKPAFTVQYDAAQWRLVDDDAAPALHHVAIDGCVLGLRGPAMEMIYVGSLDLGGRRWTVASNGPDFPDWLVYSTRLDGYAAIFPVTMPSGTDAVRLACRDAAEEVLCSFASPDAAVDPTPVLTIARFSVDDPTTWPMADTERFVLRLPPGWTISADGATGAGAYVWTLRGVLPGSADDHFVVEREVKLIVMANPERLAVQDWVSRFYGSTERAPIAVEERTFALGAGLALARKTIFAPADEIYLATWLACGGHIWMFNTGGGALRPELVEEEESIFAHIVQSFQCWP